MIPYPPKNPARLCEVDHVVGQGPVRFAYHAYGQVRRLDEAPWRLHHDAQRVDQHRRDAVSKDVMSARLFGEIVSIRKRLLPTAQGNANYLEAVAFQCQYFTTNKGVADLGVLVDEISDFQAMRYLYSISRDCARRSRSRWNLS